MDHADDQADLGFTYRRRQNGDIEILHHQRIATVLRGREAQRVIGDLQRGDLADVQQLMARLTGNYKRGNERQARNHPRNRR